MPASLWDAFISTIPLNSCRQRYVDMIMSEETRGAFRARSRIIFTIRRYLEDRAFLEVGAFILFASVAMVVVLNW